jgi:Transcription factor WhiB
VTGVVGTPGGLTDAELARLLYSGVASCTDSGVDTAAWFPASRGVRTARVQAASAIALCDMCPLRSECLEFSMRYWYRGGEEGVWAGLVGAERLRLRLRWLAGESPGELLADRTPAVRARRLVKGAIGIIRNGGGTGQGPIGRKAMGARAAKNPVRGG